MNTSNLRVVPLVSNRGIENESSVSKKQVTSSKKTTLIQESIVLDMVEEDADHQNQIKNFDLRDSRSSSFEEEQDSADRYPLRECKIPLWGGEYMNFNWLTSGLGIILLWGSVAYCLADPSTAIESFGRWKSNSIIYFTWLFIGTRPLWMLFVAYIAFKYGNIRLGKDHNVKPEFDNVTYFTMIFSAGVAVGLFFYGVSEPLAYASSQSSTLSQTEDDIDQNAINQTLYHWGLAAWISYVLTGLVVGLGSYRFGLPFTIRSTLYPLLGDYTWGYIGDVLDGFSIWVTVAGVCTSLGIGAQQIVAGLIRLGAFGAESGSLTEHQMIVAEAVTIVIITLIATASVVSGLECGIKTLSQIGFGLGMLLLFLVFTMDNTKFLLNLMVQSTGYYFQWNVVQVNFETNAFEKLAIEEGNATYDESTSASWMDSWTVFYMAWWTAWSGFVGIFIARISKGRTILEVVLYNLVAPLLYSIIWFCIFGGVGLRQARQAEDLIELGQKLYGDPRYYQNSIYDYCYDVPQQDIVNTVNGTSITMFHNVVPGVTPVCLYNSTDSTNAWYNVMYSFSYPTTSSIGDSYFGAFMAGLSIVAVALYFVTSSDSASLVVDQFASNGRTSHHWLQRIFWAFTEGATACALLVAGGSDAIEALQAASVVAGLPFTFVLMYQCRALWIMCDCAEKADVAQEGETLALTHLNKYTSNTFDMPVYGGICNIMEYICSGGQVHEERKAKNMDLPQASQAKEFLIGLIAPYWSIYRIRQYLYPTPMHRNTNLFYAGCVGVLFFAWIALFAAAPMLNHGFEVFGWATFFCYGIMIQRIRSSVRQTFHNLNGDLIADFAISSFLYPQAVAQMIYQFEKGRRLPRRLKLNGDKNTKSTSSLPEKNNSNNSLVIVVHDDESVDEICGSTD